jgi:chromosome segregation ATPase
MCFLLALQRLIKSPIRAIDEFEAHLDPKNREHLFRSVAEVAGTDTAQYILITPGRLAGIETASNVVVVQSVGGISRVGVVS